MASRDISEKAECLLRACDLNFKRDGKEIIKHCSLEILAGRILCLLGPSGVGKSTLLSLLAGSFTPTFGRIEKHSLRIGYLEQGESLIPWLSVRNNVMIGAKLLGEADERRKEEAEEILAALLLAQHLKKKPAMLSGGMRRRAELAALLIAHPDLLLLDEPTTGLDLVTQEIVHEQLLKYVSTRKAAAVVVTHSLEEATRLANHVYVIRGMPLELEAPVEARSYAELSKLCSALWHEELLFRCAA